MRAWENYWYAPVAAIRPYLLFKGFLLILALDICLLMVKEGHWYGLGGFNIAHFPVLDSVQPLPSPAIYIGTMLLAALLALTQVLGPIHRGLLALLFFLYTYGWSMSVIDGFQHHYFISIVLACVAFFPKITATSLSNWHAGKGTALPGGPRASAWSYRLLGVSIAVVYAYTTIAKLDATWRSGFTLRQFVRP